GRHLGSWNGRGRPFPSFPTRRSSDLFSGWRMPSWLGEGGLGPFPNRNHTAHVLALGGVLAIGCCADAARRGRMRAVSWILFAARSEEHTSELQSLRHLVCRLLLEKKK